MRLRMELVKPPPEKLSPLWLDYTFAEKHVAVVIPSKNPPMDMLNQTLTALYDNVDHSYGTVSFHFGVDMGDTTTMNTIRSAFTKLNISHDILNFHQVDQF